MHEATDKHERGIGVVTDTNNALLDTVAGTYGVRTNLETGVSR